MTEKNTLRQGECGGVDDDGHVEHHLESEAGRPENAGLLIEAPFQVLEINISHEVVRQRTSFGS